MFKIFQRWKGCCDHLRLFSSIDNQAVFEVKQSRAGFLIIALTCNRLHEEVQVVLIWACVQNEQE